MSGWRPSIPLLVLLIAAAGCGRRSPEQEASQATAEMSAPATAAAPFRDAAEEAGLRFTHFNGMAGRFYYAEVMGSGVGVLDYDGDGDLDVYLGQGRMLGEDLELDDATFPPAGERPPSDRLFRNDPMMRPDGTTVFRFVDVTAKAGLVADGYNMGVATGDVDNDGWTDLYITNFGPNQLWRNNGDGTFSDTTSESGTGDDRFSAGAAFLDYDRDGDLDLAVANYVDSTLRNHKTCYAASGIPDYCGPTVFDPLPNRLFRNRGDGTFDDASLSSGIGHFVGRTLGVVVSDFDDDGWPDLYFANDADENELWMNQGDGTFTNQALLAGVAVNLDGMPEASMGVDAGDFDNDGDDDLFMTHLASETNTLYVNNGLGDFTDGSLASGLAAPSWSYTGFGTSWFDYDNDGWLDLIAVNGEVRIKPELVQQGDPFPLDEPNLLFRNLGGGLFADVTQQAGAPFSETRVSRGAAFGDLDNDGDTDVVILNNCDPATLLENSAGPGSNWLGLRLLGGEPGRDMIGTRVRVEIPGAATLTRRVRSEGSYLSANDPRLRIGLGAARGVARIEARWPDGRSQAWEAPPMNRYIVVVRKETP